MERGQDTELGPEKQGWTEEKKKKKKKKQKETKRKNAKRRRKGQPLDSSPIDDRQLLFVLSHYLGGKINRTSVRNKWGALTSVGFRRGILELFIGGMAVSRQGLCCVMLSIRIVINNNMLVTVNITTIININNNVNNNVNSAIPDQIS